jgi:hypothetical protein
LLASYDNTVPQGYLILRHTIHQITQPKTTSEL